MMIKTLSIRSRGIAGIGGRGDEKCDRPGRQSLRGGKVSSKVNILNNNKKDFCPQQILNY